MPIRLRLSLFLLLAATYALTSFGSQPGSIGGYDDSDGDGLDDEIEFHLGTDPTQPDTDSDAWSDLAELIHGTDPCDPKDYPRLSEESTPPAPTARTSQRQDAIRLSSGPTTLGRRPERVTGGSLSVRFYHLPGLNPDVAAEMQNSTLTAGGHLLLWSQMVRQNPLQIRQHYVVSIRRNDGKVIGEWPTPAEVDTRWRHVGLAFTLTPEDQLQGLTITIIPTGGAGLQYNVGNFIVLPAELEVDADRDGIIVAGERPTAGRPLRHWVNDDDDTGDCQEKADLPGLAAHEADHGQPGIDGRRDLVDFIPLNLAIGSVVRRFPPSAGFRYHLGNDDRALQVVPTSLTRATVGALHRNTALAVFGPTLDGPCTEAEVLKPDAEGSVELPESFLHHVMVRNHGIVLLEASRPTVRPLRLEIRKDDGPVTRLELPLAVAPVETMYRHVDLTPLGRTYAGVAMPTKTMPRRTFVADPPGLPDAESGGSWVVMVHGYNVSARAARGWQAETFKRLRALGSNARFVGVTWNGDTGLDYHQAVFQAFQAGDGLPRALRFVDAARTTLVAHSLGNIVACQGVQSGFTPAHYFLLNAALPIEAIAGESATQPYATDMTEASWRAYPRRLFASDWSKLHAPGRQRHGYAWPNCFSRVRLLGDAINCFSAGEDVTNCPPAMKSASVLATLWAGRSVDYGVWKTQELLKGVGWTRSLGTLPMERSQAGWGFNTAWRGPFVPSGPDRLLGGRHELLSPAVAARITDAQLLTHPFFRPFEQRWLHAPSSTPASPLIEAPRVRYDLLARGIPALSPAAGSTPMPATGGPGSVTNYDLESQGRPAGIGWPTEGHHSPLTKDRWLHSDFKNVALPFAYPLFLTMINRGGLR
jgi:hypothetical protein